MLLLRILDRWRVARAEAEGFGDAAGGAGAAGGGVDEGVDGDGGVVGLGGLGGGWVVMVGVGTHAWNLRLEGAFSRFFARVPRL